jgi:bis(5'-nucleosidyl)-tetraphosphatase
MRTLIYEHSAGVIPFRSVPGRTPLYLVIHSATVRNPRARWEFPKGGIEPGETPREAAGREFREETGIASWTILEGFEQILSYTYMRQGRECFKTVTFFVAEVLDVGRQERSHEHVEDPSGQWYRWGTVDEILRRLYHPRIRQVIREADSWIRMRGGTMRRDDAETGAMAAALP